MAWPTPSSALAEDAHLHEEAHGVLGHEDVDELAVGDVEDVRGPSATMFMPSGLRTGPGSVGMWEASSAPSARRWPLSAAGMSPMTVGNGMPVCVSRAVHRVRNTVATVDLVLDGEVDVGKAAPQHSHPTLVAFDTPERLLVGGAGEDEIGGANLF